MLEQYVFVYLIGNDEKENESHKNRIKSSVINAAVESYSNSWIAFNALRSDSGSGKQPDIIIIDYHMLEKNGFNFLEEYNSSSFFDKEKTKLYLLSSNKNKNIAEQITGVTSIVKTLVKPLTDEVIEKLIEL